MSATSKCSFFSRACSATKRAAGTRSAAAPAAAPTEAVDKAAMAATEAPAAVPAKPGPAPVAAPPARAPPVAADSEVAAELRRLGLGGLKLASRAALAHATDPLFWVGWGGVGGRRGGGEEEQRGREVEVRTRREEVDATSFSLCVGF